MGLTSEQRRARREHAALLRVIAEDRFLTEWRDDAASRRTAFHKQLAKASDEERSVVASQAGFRTWTGYLQFCKSIDNALSLFVSSAEFKKLWLALKKVDARDEPSTLPLYGPHMRGVPMWILSGIEHWYQIPKLPAAELKRHKSKIAKKASELLELLEQVSPSGVYDDFGRFAVPESDAQRISQTLRGDFKQDSVWNYGFLLCRAGVTPVWAVRCIEAQASEERSQEGVRRKMRGANAFRTHMIEVVAEAVTGWHAAPAIGDQLIADVVGLLVGHPCSLDDVRQELRGARRKIPLD